MIGTSTSAYIFIRACAIFLSSIAPLSVTYCIYFCIGLFGTWSLPRLPWWAEAYILCEVTFYLFIYPYLKRRYQHPATHPAKPSPEARHKLFHRCHDTLRDPEAYLRKWFKNAPASEIKRDNVKEFLAWAFLNTDIWNDEEDAELDEYVTEFESLLGRSIPLGRGTALSLRLTLDPHDPLHRSLLWYGCVAFVDFLAFVHMRFHGFHFHRAPLSHFFTLFPFRPVSLFTTSTSPSKTLTYWHRAHTSKTKLPILFIHGIGIGLYPYVKFLGELNASTTHHTDKDGDVGIIALEIPSISFRLTSAPLTPSQFRIEVSRILAHHGWEKVVLVSHSYGSVLSTHLLQSPPPTNTASPDVDVSSKIGPTLLIDPVCFLLHLPDVAYNFTIRTPQAANEWQLWYFASKDPGVSWTLARHFFWAENVLWREDVQPSRRGGYPTTVSLGGRDLIVGTEGVGTYLVGDDVDEENNKGTQSWKVKPWTGSRDAVEVLWWPDLDHAQVFDKKSSRRKLVNVLEVYCRMK